MVQMRRFSTFILAATTVLLGGCNLAGFLLSPTPHSKKIPAECDLRARQEQRVLVLLDVDRGSRADMNLRRSLLSTINGYLVKKARLNSRYLVDAANSPERAESMNLSSMSPIEAGRKADAGLVLLVIVERSWLEQMENRNYYRGGLVTRSVLVDTASGKVLWPKEPGGRVVTTQVELETGGYDATVARLVYATSHCIVRNFYPVQSNAYRVRDELSISPQGW